jgi:hypothetical protein
MEIKILKGTLTSIVEGKKDSRIMTLETESGEQKVSFFGKPPEVLGGDAPRYGTEFSMEVVEQPREDGGVWVNLYKPKGGSYHIEEIGQKELPSYEAPAAQQPVKPLDSTPTEAAGKDQAAEFVQYQQTMALQCVKDARQAIEGALGEKASAEAVVTLAAAMFEKRSKPAYYFKGAAK